MKLFVALLAAIGLGFTLTKAPDQFDKLVNEFRKKDEKITFEEKALQIERDFENSYKATPECNNTRSELKKLECKNRRDMAFQSFVRMRMK